ncbi:MAG TPA: glycosyltransferase family 4 protein, partial [Ferruginibacter sp.]|nr:glycosyltransferase family 4 protein [Ferruginibacter sp.]
KDELFTNSPATYHFIYIGRLLDVKFPDDILRAFNVICKTMPGCALIMAGDGPMRADLEKMALEMDIQTRVHFLGSISQDRLANLLGGCFAVLSTLTGRSLVEGALAGLPIVAYDRDWQLDFISRNSAGVIVPFRDWQKMAESAVHLIRDPEEAKRMGAASRKTGVEASDTEKIYEHERSEFDKILKR